MSRFRPGARTVACLAVAIRAAVLLGAAIRGASTDVRELYVLGDRFPHPPELEQVRHWRGTGYDGQFFGALAVDPLLLRPETAGYLDVPAYRAGRIGMPLAAWLVSLGNRRLALVVYPILVWCLSLLGVWVAARWLEEEGRPAVWALPLAFSVGLVPSMLRCVPDAAAVSLLLLGLWRERRGRAGPTAILTIAVLVRETSLLGAGAIAVARWREGRRKEAVALRPDPHRGRGPVEGVGLQPPRIRAVPGGGPRLAAGLAPGVGWCRGASGAALPTVLAIGAVLLAVVAVVAVRRPWQAP